MGHLGPYPLEGGQLLQGGRHLPLEVLLHLHGRSLDVLGLLPVEVDALYFLLDLGNSQPVVLLDGHLVLEEGFHHSVSHHVVALDGQEHPY